MGFTLQHTHEAEQQTIKELETSGAARLVNALRVIGPKPLRMQSKLFSVEARYLSFFCEPLVALRDGFLDHLPKEADGRCRVSSAARFGIER